MNGRNGPDKWNGISDLTDLEKALAGRGDPRRRAIPIHCGGSGLGAISDHQGLPETGCRPSRSRRTPRWMAPPLAGLPPHPAAHGRARAGRGLPAGLIGCIIEYPWPRCQVEEANFTLAGPGITLNEQNFLLRLRRRGRALGLPITAVFLLAQKWIVSGLTAGGVKASEAPALCSVPAGATARATLHPIAGAALCSSCPRPVSCNEAILAVA